MLFNTTTFAIFLVVAFGAHWRARPRYRNAVLLVASYFFYGWWDWRFLGLLALSTATDYTIGLRLAGAGAPRRRTRLLVMSAAVNLGILAAFKYHGFFLESFGALSESLGLGRPGPGLELVLPVGISFYTFQTLSYTIDVYRGRVAPTRNLIDFATYVAYFPQLVAGPIERARALLPQVSRRTRAFPSPTRLRSALLLILQGLFKKVVIADGVARVADAAFSAPGEQSWLGALVGITAFGIQIYGDFSGYTDIARGVSRLFGIELVVNFRQPYLSRNITEFWRRWHISLSNWLRDYLYIPLGGNRGGRARTYRNLMITMLLGGLWHGAAWTFVAWGGLHGLYLVAHRLRSAGAVPDTEPGLGDLPRILVTWLWVHLAWVFFRAETFTDAFDLLEALVTARSGSLPYSGLAVVLILGAAMLAVDLGARRPGLRAAVASRPAASGAALAIVVVAVLLFSGGQPAPFIYFQF